MAVNLTNADSALKSLYLDAISHQLDNNVNPLLSAISKSTNDVWGKEVRKLCTFGVNGGINAGTEDGNLPTATGNNYTQFVSTLKNLYGVIEISDKAIRASENNSGAFVSLLNSEMEGLIKSSTFNFGRMLFGDGTGALATVSEVKSNVFYVDNVKNIMEGMLVDIRDASGNIISGLSARKVVSINRALKQVTLSGATVADQTFSAGAIMTVQASYNHEITGLGAIFGDSANLYGVNRSQNAWLMPYTQKEVGEISELTIQTALDAIEERSGRGVNFIVCSWGVRRALQQLFGANRRSIDTMELNGGFKAMNYNGIPIVADRFCPEGTMYLLNTNDFTLHQLCDWQWLADDDGRVLKQIPGKPVYTATLVKYAELICSCPNGQGMLSGITEA
ncbi:MAG: phage major capsid protein [Clostridiales bacterium]|nr:phage major capsid protein [Clostridiales bacterium]